MNVKKYQTRSGRSATVVIMTEGKNMNIENSYDYREEVERLKDENKRMPG